MNRKVLTSVVAAASFLAAGAGALPWDLIASYPLPINNPRGHQIDSTHGGFTIGGGSVPYVYRYYLPTGSIFSSFPAPGGSGAWGIAGEFGELFISNNQTSWIYRINTYGSVISSFPCPIPGPADMDLRWYPDNLYIAIPDQNLIAVVDEDTGSLVSTFAAPGSRPTACCGYQTLLVADATTNTIYEDGVPVITGIETPYGIDELSTTGTDYIVTLYVVDDTTNYIYLYEQAVAVAPASLGRVKALFQ